VNKKLIYVYLRTPKTGSTTLTRCLREGLGEKCLKNKYPDSLTKEMVIDKEVIFGHYLTYPLPIIAENIEFKYFTMIRDPADWVLSIYHHMMNKHNLDIPFWKWYHNDRHETPHGGDNPLFNWFKIISLKGSPYDLLDNCWFVGLTERTDIIYPWLINVLGGVDLEKNSNVNKRVYELTEGDREVIYSLNPLDVDLYSYAVRLFDEKYKKMIVKI